MKYTAYHATYKNFPKPTTFDFAKMQGMDYGPGFYLALDPRDTKRYGWNLFQVEVELKNPVRLTKGSFDRALTGKLTRALRIDESDLFESNKLLQIMQLLKTLFQTEILSVKGFIAFMQKLGYDGIYVDPSITGNTIGAYIAVFSPEQIMTWEPADSALQRNTGEHEEAVESELVERIDDVASFLAQPGKYHTSSGHQAFGVVEALSWHPMVKMGEQLSFPEGEVRFVEVLSGDALQPNEMIPWQEADDWTDILTDYDRWEMAWWREVIQNARDAKGPGAPDGPTKIELECKEDTYVDPETGESTPAMLVVCRDNGTGMDAETLPVAFFKIRGSVKPRGSVGGFGDAKELILAPWLGYEVRTRDNMVRGRHHSLFRPGLVTGQPFLQGTEVKVWMPLTKATTPNYAMLLVERCHLPGIRVILNGQKLSAALTGGKLVLQEPVRLATEKEVGQIQIHHQGRSERKGIYVRANGVYMFDMNQFATNLKGIVYVDINAPPRNVFTTKRDQLSAESTARNTVFEAIRRITVDPKSALRKERGTRHKIEQVFSGTGAFEVREGLAAQIAAEVMAKVKQPTKPPKSGDLMTVDDATIKDAVDAVAEQAANPALSGAQDDVDMSPSPASAEIILKNTKFISIEQITSAIRFSAWKPDFYVFQNLDFWRMPAKLHPATMEPKYQKLIRLYAELAKLALCQLGEFRPFGVGWCFETEYDSQTHSTLAVRGMAARREGRDWLLLNPIDLKVIPGRSDEDPESYEDQGDRFDLSSEADLEGLCTTVLHEVTHLQGFSDHDEAYAGQLTQNMRIALRGMKIAAKKLLKVVSIGVREEVREAKAAKTALKEAPWTDVVGSVLYLLHVYEGNSSSTREELASVTPVVNVAASSKRLHDMLHQMAPDAGPGKKIDTQERAAVAIQDHWPDWKRHDMSPLTPKQLVVIHAAILALGIILPPQDVLERLISDSIDSVPRDPRERITSPAGVYSWTKQGGKWVLRAGYVGQRGDKLAEFPDTLPWDEFHILRNLYDKNDERVVTDAKYVFGPSYGQAKGSGNKWSLFVGPPDNGSRIEIDREANGTAYLYAGSLNQVDRERLNDLRSGSYSSVAEAQAAVVDVLVRHEAAG